MSSWAERVIRFFFPPRCCACGTLLPITEETGLCSTCANEYQEAKQKLCPKCVRPYHRCDCTGRLLHNKNLKQLIKLFHYTPRESTRAENRLIYRLKHTDSRQITDFLSCEMAKVTRPHLKPNAKYAVVGAPRSKQGIRKDGFDHVERLGQALAKELSLPYMNAVLHTKETGEQKKKNRRERIASAAKAYGANPRVDLHGYRVILIDDVTTTGATLLSCATVVRKMGARGVLCCVVGSSFSYRDIEERRIYEAGRKKYYMPYIKR